MTFGGAFVGAYKGQKRNPANRAGWWNLWGQIPLMSCVAAYQPKGAVDLASSKVNIVTPGIYNVTGAFTWDVTNGWKNSAADTGYSIGSKGDTTTIIMRCSDWGTNFSECSTGNVSGGWFSITPGWSSTSSYNMSWGGGILGMSSCSVGSRVFALAGNMAYYEGNYVNAIGTQFGYNANTWIANRPSRSLYVQALAIYSIKLSGATIASLTTAIKAL